MNYKGFEIYVEYNTYEIFRVNDDGSLGEFVDSESDGSLRGYAASDGQITLYRNGNSLEQLMQDIDAYMGEAK